MDPNMVSSSKSLVSGNRAAKLPQYIAALSATLGGFVAGLALGWTSPVQERLTNVNCTGGYHFGVMSPTDFNWVGGLSAIGAMVGSLAMGPISDHFGRRLSMISLLVPSCLGWGLILWANSAGMIQGGRFVTGAVAGAMSVVGPLYTTEIAETEIRGILGTFFQLQVTLGILYVYILGVFDDTVSVQGLNIACFVIPFVFAAAMILMPESPQFFLLRNRRADAEKSLRWLRGSAYDLNHELDTMQADIEKLKSQKISLRKGFSSPAAIRGVIIGLTIMFLQQFSGINAIVYYTTNIFQAAGSTLKAEISTLIVGVVMFVMTIVSSLVIDRLGRKPLLLASGLVMGVMCVIVGVFFFLKDYKKQDVANIGWLPLTCVCIFIIMFSLGFGPIPWMYMAEIFPAEIKGPACSIASMFNWVCVFIITFFFQPVTISIGTYSVFWIFAGCSLAGTVFILIFMPETKGRSFEEIQRVLGNAKKPKHYPTGETNRF